MAMSRAYEKWCRHSAPAQRDCYFHHAVLVAGAPRGEEEVAESSGKYLCAANAQMGDPPSSPGKYVDDELRC